MNDPREVDPRPLLERYFRALEAADFEAVADCFTEDGYYVHPPFPTEPPGSPDHATTGRAEMLEIFRLRGVGRRLHHIDRVMMSGSRGFVSGVTTDLLAPEDPRVYGYFVAEFVLSDDGRFRWFAAFGRPTPRGAAFLAVHGVPPLERRLPPPWAKVPTRPA